MEDKFTWVPFFEELLDKICKEYNPHSLYRKWSEFFPEQYNDIDQIDPLTFIGSICAGNKIAIERAAKVKKDFNIQANSVKDINGIPNFVHGAYKYFHEIYKGADINAVMQTLWNFANQLNQNDINEETFNTILGYNEVKVGKLSQIMYVCKPHIFYTCDSTMLSFLYKSVDNSYNSFKELQEYCKTFNILPYELSARAWEYSCQRKSFVQYIEQIKPSVPSYEQFLNGQFFKEIFENKIFELVGKKLYDIKNENDLNNLLKELKSNNEWNTYDTKYKNGIPHAILNTHYRNFINNVKPEVFHPGLTTEDWINLLSDTEILKHSGMKVLELMYKNGGEASCKQLALFEGSKRDANYYKGQGQSLAMLVFNKTNCKKLEFENGSIEWFSILFNIRKTRTDEPGSIVWQIRNEIMSAINQLKLFNTEDTEMNTIKSENKISKNQILYGPPGTGKTYNTVIEAIKILNETLFDDYKANIKSYEDLKNEFNKLKQLGQIEFVTFHQSYSYEEFVEGIKPNLESDSLGYKLSGGTFKKIANNALFASLNILEEDSNTSFEFNKILDVFKEQYPVETVFKTEKSSFKIIDYIDTSIRVSPVDSDHIYSVSYQPLEEMFKIHIENPYSMPKDLADKFGSFKGLSTYYFNILEKLKNIHSNQFTRNINVTNEYTSEQKNLFIKKFYKKEISTKDNNKPYVLIIDEINRGNISKIFGELITLLEEDKRENLAVKLPYSQEDFTVPKNLYILGTMNTSDRSIASVDIALRRRFVFKEMMPDSKLVSDFGCNFKKCFEVLNERISILLDRDHQIGHSYFINEKYANSDINTLENIWFDSIIPLLNEYFYGDWEKLQAILGEAKDDNTSFIKVKKVDKDSFAAKVDFCDDKSYDFNFDCKQANFSLAMKNAFGNNFNGVTND